MTSDEKETIYNLLKLSSSWVYGYKSPKFQGDSIAFDDDVIEFVEPKPAPSSDAMATEVPQSEAIDIESAPPKVTGQQPSDNGGITIESICSKISTCRNCVLSNTRTNTVPGEGVQHPYVMVIGEGPGEDEDKTGRPFVGKAGQLLDKMLAAIGLSRTTNCYIANIVKCRPPMNRTPMPDEANACAGYLQAQIHILKPKFILAMGRTAAQNLLKTNTGINTLRGNWLELQFGNEKIPLMATFHPSALLRDERLKAPAWQDLKKFREKLLAEKPDYAEVFYTQQ
ncbi:uracil-DNA glycosylase [Treponema sp.]|uniref:uracil-DNA glycosylase n=1 Tax=Treponema sp. TaxID=166 RepID=UPI00388D32B3